jgi:hypothetical protein
MLLRITTLLSEHVTLEILWDILGSFRAESFPDLWATQMDAQTNVVAIFLTVVVVGLAVQLFYNPNKS